jgi:hypothetical protein
MAGSRREAGSVLMVTLVAVTVLGQRISLPISTGVSLLLPVTLALLLVGLRLGVFEWERLRLGLYAACTGLAAFVALVNAGRGTGWSPASLALLVVLYLPLCCVVEHGRRDRARTAALTTFVRLLTVLAWASLLYLLLQVTGVLVYRDLLADVVPDAFLNTGFNTANPYYYGSPYYRANGFFFLEPSFFSQALGSRSWPRSTCASRPGACSRCWPRCSRPPPAPVSSSWWSASWCWRSVGGATASVPSACPPRARSSCCS